jgi:hypothetical protein
MLANRLHRTLALLVGHLHAGGFSDRLNLPPAAQETHAIRM